ncbi:MAG TPA: VTT domain-containing protein [Burkholderiales bacterium]|nr:VTT domain-containing protein [Burkholderiales bacterium]
MARKGQRRGPAWGKIAAIAVAIALLAAAWRWTPLADLFTSERILDWARVARGTWWAPLAVMAAYVLAALVLFPRPLVTLATIIAFGTSLGIAYAIAGVLSAALVTYYAGRFVKRSTVRRFAGDRIEAAAKPLREHGIVAVFAANMVPTPPFAVQNMIAGALRIPLAHFLAGTALSLVPPVLAWTMFGAQINRALEDASQVSWWLVGGALVLLAGFGYFARRWVRARGF